MQVLGSQREEELQFISSSKATDRIQLVFLLHPLTLLASQTGSQLDPAASRDAQGMLDWAHPLIRLPVVCSGSIPTLPRRALSCEGPMERVVPSSLSNGAGPVGKDAGLQPQQTHQCAAGARALSGPPPAASKLLCFSLHSLQALEHPYLATLHDPSVGIHAHCLVALGGFEF